MIIITIIIIIIIIIIIVMKSGAPLLGLAKSFYYILVYTGKNPQFPRLVKSCFLLDSNLIYSWEFDVTKILPKKKGYW